jgi:crotonobetainyl-CoA:carnitine CoA-transferase CaiB-like acyl-CoA transferase
MVQNKYIIDVPVPNVGNVKMLNVPYKLSETPGSVRCAAPELGQHTEEVLHELCGYSWDKITELRKKEVI